MYDLDQPPAPGDLDWNGLDALIERASGALLQRQLEDGHWVFELEADATIPAEYILLRHYLGEPDDLELETGIGRYLRRLQGEHGGWPLVHGGPFDLSASIKAYFALKMIGDDPEGVGLSRAREAILAAGGLGAANVFTRLQLALYGELPWSLVPTMPAEIILLPRWFPIHLSKMSYWARTVIAPLLVLQVLKPRARNLRGVRVGELLDPALRIRPQSRAAGAKRTYALAFQALDRALKAVEPLWPARLRARALQRCVAFVTERLNGEDGLGAIYPAMANSVMMFDALGQGPEEPRRAAARRAVEALLVRREDGQIYCQPCVSPVWDTALVCHALLETGGTKAEEAALGGLHWLKSRQILDVRGDWADQRPGVRPGGWAFQYNNAYYPDLDDTAVVVMALDRSRRVLGAAGFEEAIARGAEWTMGLQSRDGGYAAFDADNHHHYLNTIPFADHGALLDPSTEDVTGRVVSMLAQLQEPAGSPRLKDALAFLERTQTPEGSWFGRWGVNYIYGVWSVLCGLNAAGVGRDAPMVRRARDWLISIQNPDGGWGEDCSSYALDYAGHAPAASRASQTAWALLGLMAAGEVDHPAVTRGIRRLLQTQGEDGFWSEPDYTGGGFPRVFYLRYHGYSKVFPLWAAARYRTLKRSAAALTTPWGL